MNLKILTLFLTICVMLEILDTPITIEMHLILPTNKHILTTKYSTTAPK
jgi:hypothetical protein